MAERYQTTAPDMNMHLRNIFEEVELEPNAIIKNFLIVRSEYDQRSKSQKLKMRIVLTYSFQFIP